jgi:hypothetical protein
MDALGSRGDGCGAGTMGHSRHGVATAGTMKLTGGHPSGDLKRPGHRSIFDSENEVDSEIDPNLDASLLTSRLQKS